MARPRLRLTRQEVQLFRNGREAEPARRIRLGTFLTALHAEPEVQTPLLPPGVRWYFRRRDTSVVVLEEPPALRTVAGRIGGRVTLSIPYVVFIVAARHGSREVSVGEVYAFFRKKPLKKLSDRLLQAGLPGVNEDDGLVCMDEPSAASLQEVLEKTRAVFWRATFDDYAGSWGFPYRYGSRYFGLEDWVRASRRNPRAGLSIRWPSSGWSSVRQRVNELLCCYCADEDEEDAGEGKSRPRSLSGLVDLVMQCPEQ